MANINYDNLTELVGSYKKYFIDKYSIEIYKWKAVKHFQNHWNTNADDFKGMLMQALDKTDNLLRSMNNFPKGMLKEFCEMDSDKVRDMFINLYDENKELSFRMNSFMNGADELLKIWGKGKNHYQNYNAITTYLWLRYPDKYYIYKYSCAKALAKKLNASFVPKKGITADGIIELFRMYDEIASFLRKDSDIRTMLDSVLTEDCYHDDELRTTVVDFAYFAELVSRYGQALKIEKTMKAENNNRGEDGQCRYWWLCANPRIWSMSGWVVGEEQDYTLYNAGGNKRRVFQNFLDAKVGDKVICYETNPTKQITGLATVSKESDGKRIYFKKEKTLTSPIDFSVIKSEPELTGMEFLVNPNGSFFHLTKDEYVTLLGLIYEENDNPLNGSPIEKYMEKDFLSDVYMSEDDLNALQHLVQTKKNVILQGAPGVGKTFCARRLAWLMMKQKDDSRVAFIQFHQNYSYEDFVMGYKPEGNTFVLRNGLFYKLCMNAANNPGQDYFFIIDEINRGNLSKIFGELLMLIENGHRGEKLTLAYKDEKFSVPENIYIIGMMNTADRSLALIDYALRRRFSFFEMRPGFDTAGFKAYQKSKNNATFDALVQMIKDLNREIAADDSLGVGFEIGHSYLCTEKTDIDRWMKSVVKYDIIPLLQEYWFDNRQQVKKWADKLNGIFND